MAVITISRQLGSLGYEIGEQVAQRLGYRIVWRELINQAAARSGAPEMALAMIDELGLLGMKPSQEQSQAYCQAVQAVMLELADTGNVVIVGRAGQVILAGRRDTLHVRILAPLELRAQRLAQGQRIALSAARAQVAASDRHRRLYLKHCYQVEWNEPEFYDLVLNTARLSLEAAVDVICCALHQRVPDAV